MEDYGTIWVCRCCMLHHANGECCDDMYYGQDPDHNPLSLISRRFWVTMGMLASEHPCSADHEPMQEREHECDCETNLYSTSSCDGCGSSVHGERYAMTLWKD